LATILERHSDLCLANLALFDTLLEFFFNCGLKSSQDAIIPLLILFCRQSPECQAKMLALLLEKLNIETDRFGYDPEASRKGSHGLTGLRNIGTTCYMNAIFQQLYHNESFRTHIFRSHFDKDWLIELRNLFITMARTQKQFADTQPFVSKLKFPMNNLVNPRQQHDAPEFLQFMLDRIGDTLYKGEMANIMIGDDFHQSRSESFFMIELVVKNCKSFDDSITSFLEKEKVLGYFAESLGCKIDIMKFAKVRTVPNFLVIQLKRFEYDISTWQRTKVTTKFSFPREFDLGPLLEQENQHEMFTLTGVVLHAGTSQGGHYTSCVKIQNKWFDFDDAAVTEIAEASVLNDFLGGSSYGTYTDYETHRPSAYLLFYTKSGFVDSDLQLALEGADSELLSAIDQENRLFLQMQTIFSPGMMNIVLEQTDICLLLRYLLNILAHSNHGPLAQTFGAHFLTVTEKQQASDYVLELFTEKLSIIESVFIRSNEENIIQLFEHIIRFLIHSAAFAKSLTFISKIFESLLANIQNWRVIPHFVLLIVSFLEQYPDWSRDNGWLSRLVSFTKTALESTRSSVFLQNFNISSFFRFLYKSDTLLSKEDLEVLCSVAGQILQSQGHSEFFIELMLKACNLGLIALSSFVESLISAVKDSFSPSVVTLFIHAATNETILMQFLESPRVSNDALLLSLYKNVDDPVIRTRLLCTNRMLFHLLTCRPPSASEHAADLVLGLFPVVSALSKYTPIEYVFTQRTPMVDFTWKDYETARFAVDDDLPLLSSLADSLVTGLGTVSANLDRYVTDTAGAHFELAALLRTAAWAVYRSQFELSKTQLSVVLELFEAFDRLKLGDNVNLMELLRFLRVAGTEAARVLFEQFDRLVAIIFGAVYSHHLLPPWNFVLFFDSFKPVLELHPVLFESLFASPQFVAAFAASAAFLSPDVLRGFLKLTSQLSIDITPLVAANWQSIVKGHGFTAVELFSRAPAFELSNEIYTRLIVIVLATATVSHATGRTQETLRAAAAYLAGIGERHQLTDLADLKEIVPSVIARIGGRKATPIVPQLSQLLLAATRQSRELRDWVRTQIKEEASAALATLKLRFDLHDTEGIEGRVTVAAHCATVFPVDAGFDQGVIFQVFTELVIADGFAPHREWANLVFEAICRRHRIGSDEQAFVRSVAKQIDGARLVEFASALRHHFVNDDFADSVYFLSKLNVFAEQQPALRGALLAAGGFVGDAYAQADRDHGSSFPHLFVRTV
jgi:ubiquitin C-terminal hydrolase